MQSDLAALGRENPSSQRQMSDTGQGKVDPTSSVLLAVAGGWVGYTRFNKTSEWCDAAG
jgi:hypothetical protein